MRVTSIELTGTPVRASEKKNGEPGLPRAFAKMSRKLDDEYITVELVTPGSDHIHHVQADDRDDLWSMAEILQEALDGCKGTNGDINEYFRSIRMLGD